MVKVFDSVGVVPVVTIGGNGAGDDGAAGGTTAEGDAIVAVPEGGGGGKGIGLPIEGEAPGKVVP
ncbi:MAG: hypothetical protein NZU63_01515 [Gemmataceae bacterium]|nr:hypothetical protein [Gemmataceae bacterium]